MNRKIVIAATAALTIAASAAPAMAQGGHRSFHTGWGWGGWGWGGPSFGLSVGFGDYGWGSDYAYGGFGYPSWGYDDWNYGAYAAAPAYGCSCANRFRTARVWPRYRSSFAFGGYPYDYAYTSSPSASFGVTLRGHRFNRSRHLGRIRVSDRDFTSGRREMRGAGLTRERFSERASVRGTGDVRGSASGEIRGTSGRGSANVGTGSGVNVGTSGGERGRGGENR